MCRLRATRGDSWASDHWNTYDNFIHHNSGSNNTKKQQQTNKQSLTKENNYSRYCDDFNKNLSIGIGLISLRSLN